MYPNPNMYGGFMPRQVAFPQNGYPQGYGGAYQSPYMAAQGGQQVATQAPQEPPITDIRFLTSDEMKAFIVFPNTKVLLIDKEHGVACLKSADAMGQSTISMYSFNNIKDFTKEEEKQTATAPSYENEIKELMERVERLENAKNNRPKGSADGK